MKRVITSRRALGTHQDRHPYWALCDQIANALSHRVTANSRAVWYDTIARDGIDPRKMVVIPNGLDVGRFDNCDGVRVDFRKALGLGSGDVGVVMVANLIPYKGHADLLLALKRVLIGHSEVRVFFVGEDRGIRASLEQLALELGIAQQVVFLGRRDDVPEILMAMDLYVSASHEEGFSNALLEAMAAGLPIVATDVGGNREALEDGRLGVLVPPRDPDRLATALAAMLASQVCCAEFASLGKAAVASRYSVERMVAAHELLYTE